MRTTLNIDDRLLRAAMRACGEAQKTRVIHLGLASLVRRAAAERLAALGGTAADAKAAPRRRARQDKPVRPAR